MITSSDTVNSTVDKFVADKSTELDTRIDAINTSVTTLHKRHLANWKRCPIP